MKLILASADFSVKEVVRKCIEFVDKPKKEINFAIINEAYAVENADHKWILDSLDAIRKNFGGNIELINLLALDIKKIEERISLADVIFVLGGNTEYLKTVFDKSGFSKLLPKLLETKVYVGNSAGSMILGHLPSYKNQDKYYGEVEHYNVKKYLDLVDLSIFPHFKSKYVIDQTDKWVINESKEVDYPVYVLSDNAALVVDDNNHYVIGKNYFKLLKGEIVEKG